MRTFQERLGGGYGAAARQPLGPPEHGKSRFACLRFQTSTFVMLWGKGCLYFSNGECQDDKLMAVLSEKLNCGVFGVLSVATVLRSMCTRAVEIGGSMSRKHGINSGIWGKGLSWVS